MADSVNTATSILKVCATTANRLPHLPIVNGQLIFVQDLQRIALDFKNKRVFYNQIIVLEAEAERAQLETPIKGAFYFVVDTAVLWRYDDEWVPLTTRPQEVVYIGTSMPELGVEQTLYVNKQEKEISVWDDSREEYSVVADKTECIANEDIDAWFK